MPTTSAHTGNYRVTSLTESASGRVTVNFTEDVASPSPTQIYGSFSQTFSATDGAQFFPGQVYTLTLTKNA